MFGLNFGGLMVVVFIIGLLILLVLGLLMPVFVLRIKNATIEKNRKLDKIIDTLNSKKD